MVAHGIGDGERAAAFGRQLGELGWDLCDARTVTNEARTVTWHISALEDLAELDRWCRAVGPPIEVPSPRDQIFEAAELSDLVALTWNAHLFEGGDQGTTDARGYAATLGLSMLYVPSMRNGSAVREDRGSDHPVLGRMARRRIPQS